MAESTSVFGGLQATEKGLRALDRLKEVFGVDALPASFATLAASENGVHDLYMNLNRQLADGKLERKAKLLVAVAVAANHGSAPAVEMLSRAAIAAGRSQQDVVEAISVAAVCAIFNGYYRFRYQLPPDLKATFENYRAPFNANTFIKSTLHGMEVESICIAVSSANNCPGCVAGHIDKGKHHGLTDEQIDEVVRAGAVAFALAGALAAVNS